MGWCELAVWQVLEASATTQQDVMMEKDDDVARKLVHAYIIWHAKEQGWFMPGRSVCRFAPHLLASHLQRADHRKHIQAHIDVTLVWGGRDHTLSPLEMLLCIFGRQG
jgi:hypothetical protein